MIVVHRTPHYTVAVAAMPVVVVDNLVVVGTALAVKEDRPAAVPRMVDSTYCSHPTLGWPMRPCQPIQEYQLNWRRTCGSERIVMMPATVTMDRRDRKQMVVVPS